MRKALKDLLDHYVGMINSGDCGFWDPEKEEVVIQARAALAATPDLVINPPEGVQTCPFCGVMPLLDDPDFIYPVDREHTVWGAHCYETWGGCGASVLAYTAEAALIRWNTRTALAADKEAV